MSIQYRCRCGQEVTLRSREPVYLFVGLVFGVTVLNSILLVVIWMRLGDSTVAHEPATTPSAEAAAEAAADSAADSAPERDPEAAAEVFDRPGPADRELPKPESNKRENTPGLVPTQGTSNDETAEARSLPQPPPPQPIPIDLEETAGSATSETATDVTPSTEIELEGPGGLDSTLLWAAVEQPAEDNVDRLCGWLAAATWGRGMLATAAAERLVAAGHSSWLAAVRETRDQSATTLRLRFTGAQKHFSEQLSDRWTSLISTLEERLPRPAVRWREGLTGETPSDVVLLVDLSESMADDLGALRQALASQLPLLATTLTDLRKWGWIGYRDEVVETFSLTADVEAFLASTERWVAEGGGDVPEGVDRAIFEALRFQSFSWRPGALHHLVVIGDAPPPYERIEAMISLVAGAHQSPERHSCHTIGFRRGDDFGSDLPSFRRLARESGGTSRLVEEGGSVAEAIWPLLAGTRGLAWGDRPWQRR